MAKGREGKIRLGRGQKVKERRGEGKERNQKGRKRKDQKDEEK